MDSQHATFRDSLFTSVAINRIAVSLIFRLLRELCTSSRCGSYVNVGFKEGKFVLVDMTSDYLYNYRKLELLFSLRTVFKKSNSF